MGIEPIGKENPWHKPTIAPAWFAVAWKLFDRLSSRRIFVKRQKPTAETIPGERPHKGKRSHSARVALSYDLFDAGKRRALVHERRDEVSEAEENLRRIQDEIEVRVKMIYNRLEVTRAMVEVRREYLAAKQENACLAEDQFKQGITLASQRDSSRAQAVKARAGLLDASLAYLLAQDDLNRTLGSTAP